MKMKIFAMFAALLLAQSAAADTGGADIGDIVSIYINASESFRKTVETAARYLFGSLIVISIVLAIGKRLLQHADIIQLLAFMIPSIMLWEFQYHLMTSNWLSLGVEGFISIGQTATGMANLQPADVLWSGFDLVYAMFQTYSSGSWLTVLKSPFSSLVVAACTIAVLFSFLVLASQIAITFAQFHFFLAVSPILIAFGGLRQTSDVAAKTISSVISYGLRFLAIYFVVYVAEQAVPIMADLVTASKGMGGGVDNLYGFKQILGVVALSALLAWLAMQVPTFADSVLQGVSSLSAGDAMMPGAAAAGGAAAGALAGAAVTAATAGAGAVATATSDGAAALREVTDLSRYATTASMGSTTAGSTLTPGHDDVRPTWITNFAGAKTAQDSSDGGQGGSIGGAEQDKRERDPSRFGDAVADHVRGGLQEFAQAEKSPGAGVNIAFHDPDG
jgi:type IV secretion system protein TrbL